MASVFVEIIGWAGAVLVLLAYFLITKEYVKGDSLRYQLLNLIGSVMVLVNAFMNGALPSSAINIIWIVIALYGLSRAFKRHKVKK